MKLLCLTLSLLGCASKPPRYAGPTHVCYNCAVTHAEWTMDFLPANRYRPERWLCDRCSTP